MKILRVETMPACCLRITGRFRTKYRLPLVGLGLVFIAIGYWSNGHSGWSDSTLKLLAFAILILAFAFSRLHYSITPGKSIKTKATLIGIPFLWSTIQAATIMKYEVVDDSNDTYTLRFLNAANHRVLVIEGLSSENFANFVATSFREREHRTEQNVVSYIEQVRKDARGISPILSTILVGVAFMTIPLHLFRPEDAVNYYFYAILGCVFTLGALVIVRPRQKIVSTKDGVIEGWTEHDALRIVDYRQTLGSDAEFLLTRIRFDKFVLLYPLMIALQIAAIVLIAQWNEERKEKYRIQQENIEKQRILNEQSIQSPETQAGINLLKKFREQREAEEKKKAPTE
jgi:hypothetical protein